MSGWKRFFEIARALGLICIILILAGSGVEITMLLQERIRICLQTLVPSLFSCMAFANILQKSGAAARLGRLIPVRTFRRNPQFAGIFVLSQFAGYPVGTALLRQLADDGGMEQDTAGRMSAVCFGCGPAFAVGLVGAQVFGNAKIGWLLLFCTVAANICLLMFLPPCTEKTIDIHTESYDSVPKILTDSVADTMHGLWGICGIVLMFGVVTWLLEHFGLMCFVGKIASMCGFSAHQAQSIFSAFLDVTQLPTACRSGLSARIAIPISAFLLAFGGVCVLLQCAALGTELFSLRYLFCVRIFAGLLAAIFAYIFVPIVLKNDVVSVFSTIPQVSQTGSVLPGLLIFFVGFPILLKKD